MRRSAHLAGEGFDDITTAMDATGGEPAAAGRRYSTRTSMRRSAYLAGEEDFDDFAAMAVADGFRPQPDRMAEQDEIPLDPKAKVTQEGPQEVPKVGPQEGPQEGPSSSVPRRSSTAKAHQRESFSLWHDGAMGNVGGGIGPSRMSSVSTVNHVIRAETPYRGPSGPSHPYQMYPQNGEHRDDVHRGSAGSARGGSPLLRAARPGPPLRHAHPGCRRRP